MAQVYLVTGGAGFIGGNFVLGLMNQGNIKVINLDALTYAGNMDTLAPVMDNPNHVFVQGTILDRTLVNSLLDQHQHNEPDGPRIGILLLHLEAGWIVKCESSRTPTAQIRTSPGL